LRGAKAPLAHPIYMGSPAICILLFASVFDLVAANAFPPHCLYFRIINLVWRIGAMGFLVHHVTVSESTSAFAVLGRCYG
jgi:hypothetical protein